ncbi:MAG: hypothetical protein QOJ56_3924, partial [Mycobacterium sp.]|nr:hypothetical protein [Mycobacterium sp.]
MRHFVFAFLVAFAATPALAQPKDTLTVDLPGDV